MIPARGKRMAERGGADEGWSALMDDEVDDRELDRLLSESNDPEARGRLQRYQITRAVLRGERFSGHEFADLSGRIRDALQDESVKVEKPVAADVIPFKPRTDDKSRQKAFGDFWKSMGSIAIAASVAAVVVLGARFLDAPDGLQPGAVVADSSTERPSELAGEPEILRAPADLETDVASDGTRQSRFILRASDPRISEYQRRHLQHATQVGSGGMMPFARVVSLESEQR